MLLSAGTLAYEILLARVFAIEYFHHFAYMAIGIAMLGSGVSGTAWALAGGMRHQRAAPWFVWASTLTAVTLTLSPALVHLIALDPTQLAWDLAQWPRLALVYLLLALPFSAGALAVVLALTLEPDRLGRIYGASFLGAGLGAVLALGILWVALPARALALPAVVASAGGVVAAYGAARSRRTASLVWLPVLIALVVFQRPPWRIAVTPYKGLPQVEAYPEARRTAERTSPVGWVVAVAAPAFRFAPGLSLAFRGQFPSQTGLFVDGQIAGAIAGWDSGAIGVDMLDWLPSAAPYALGSQRRVLVIGAGGGTEISNALAHGARSVTAVELHPDIARLTQELAPPVPAPAVPPRSRVEWIVGDARSYVVRAREKFDLVVLGAAGGFGASVAGIHSLNEDFLHTVEAYAAYLERLSEGGVLAITRWLTVPPRENVRVILTAAEALRRRQPDAVPGGLAVVRTWATGTVLVKPAGFTPAEIEGLSTWATRCRFDLDWSPGISRPAAGFNQLDEPTLFLAAAAGAAGRAEATRFASTYPFDVRPVDDARPYPHHFVRTRSLRAFVTSDRGSWLPFVEWGSVVLLATLCQSVVLAALLLLVPTALRARAPGGRPTLRLIGYFTMIGLGYLAAEIAAIQQLGLLLGHPVYGVAVALAAFLVASGAGSVWSDRVRLARGWRVPATLAVMLLIYSALLLHLVHGLQPNPWPARAAIAILVLVPLAFAMGPPFPMGVRLLASGDPPLVAWAWAANGFASVIAAPLAALVALEAGSRALFLVGAVAYAGSAALVGWGVPAGRGGSGPPVGVEQPRGE